MVLPFRNARPWLARTIVSLAAEQALGLELVAIDDGSTDGSGAVVQQLCKRWNRENLQTLHSSGKGVSAARNLGAQAARSPLIAFLDADDRSIAGRLAASIQALAAQPELSHVMGGWQRISADGLPITSVEPWKEGASFDWHGALTHKAVLPSAWTIRRDAFIDVGGFDVSLHHAEDVDLLLRLAAAGHQGAWIPLSLCRYRVHSGAASRQLRPQIEGLRQVMERHLATLPADKQPWASGIRYGTVSWCSWKAWSNGNPDLALELLGEALQDCPLPLPRRPVHLLEHFARSCRRDGLPFDREALLASNFWNQAQSLLLRPR